MFNRYILIKKLIGNLKRALNLRNQGVGFDAFQSWMEEAKLTVTEDQFNKLSRYISLLKAKNQTLNLTRIVSEQEVWIKHIFDSVIAAKFFDLKPGMKVIDLGTGGGLPGIPLAILFPSIQFILADSVQKKITAVDEFIYQLALKNVQTICARAEDLGQNLDHRETYDAILTRAVAPLRILMELTLPLVHPYGNLFAYKGPDYIAELMHAKNALTKLKAEQPTVFNYSLPNQMGERTIIQVTKKFLTPETYPRRPGIPEKRPL